MVSDLHRTAFADARTRASEQRIRVIIADDQLAARRLLRRLLEMAPGVEVAAEGIDLASVIDHVDRHLPDVLVLDLSLPNGSAIAAIRQLRKRVPQTRVVALAREGDAALVQQVLDAGASAFVLKDRVDTDLLEALSAVVGESEYVSPPAKARLAAMRQATGEDGLSVREAEVLRLIALGHTSAEIALKLHLSRRTVETHRARIHRKLGLRTRAELVRYALDRHLIGC